MDEQHILALRSFVSPCSSYPSGVSFSFKDKTDNDMHIIFPSGIKGPISFLGEGLEAYVLKATLDGSDVKIKIFKPLPGEKTQETYDVFGPIPDEQMSLHAVLWARAQQFPDLCKYINRFISAGTSLLNDQLMSSAVLAYIDGHPIENRIRPGEYALSASARNDFRIIIPQIILGMKAISLAGFYHTDFYLGNVIYNSATKTAVLDDLSMIVAKPYFVNDYVEHIPDTEMIGPPPHFAFAVSDRYRAPEVLKIQNDRFPVGIYDCSSFTEHGSQYAITVALFILLTGDATFRLKLPEDVEGYNTGLEEHISMFSGKQKEFLSKGLAFLPTDRFKSYAEMKSLFERAFCS